MVNSTNSAEEIMGSVLLLAQVKKAKDSAIISSSPALIG